MRRFPKVISVLLVGLCVILSACGNGSQTIRVGYLVACDTPDVMALRKAYWSDYAVKMWHHQPHIQPCPVKRVDVSLIPEYGKPSVWVARNVSPRGELSVPRELITLKSRLCIRVYDTEIVNDPMMEHQLVNGSEHRYSSCENGEFAKSVFAGRTSDAPDRVWRQVAIVHMH